MPPKKGKGGKNKNKDKGDKDKLTQVDRTFYELTITDLNNKLAHLRSHLVKLEETNEELTETVRSMNEDRNDVTAYLDRTLTQKIDTINEMEERITELSKLRETENKELTERIKEWEAKYKATHEQLTSEIKLLNGKLNSLEEFRVQRDLLLAKFDEQEADLKEHQRMHKEAMNSMEQKAIIEKDALKKEVESKLLQLSEDFTRSSEIRNAGYTRRLIRENISLTKEIDCLILSQMKMLQEYTEAMEKAKRMDEELATNEEMKQRLLLSCQNKIEIIERLTSAYESLKIKYVNLQKYRKLYENQVKKDICEKFAYNDMLSKARILKQRIESLKVEKVKLIGMHQQHEMELLKLHDIITGLRLTIQAAVEDKEPVAGTKRKNLLNELLDILAEYNETPLAVPSVPTMSSEVSTYRPGTMGFLRRSGSSLMDVFKREARKVTSAERISPDFKKKGMVGKITPQEHSVDGDVLLDVEYGSTYYMASTQEDLELPPEEDNDEQEGGGGDYASSSTGESVQSVRRVTAVGQGTVAPATVGVKELTPKTSETNAEPASMETLAEGEEQEEDYEEYEEEDSVHFFY